jgi:hypothetical protein
VWDCQYHFTASPSFSIHRIESYGVRKEAIHITETTQWNSPFYTKLLKAIQSQVCCIVKKFIRNEYELVLHLL